MMRVRYFFGALLLVISLAVNAVAVAIPNSKHSKHVISHRKNTSAIKNVSKIKNNKLTAKSIMRSPKYASLVLDCDTGLILHNQNAFQSRRPASLTKMMTLYITFDALSKGKLKMHQKLVVSHKAAAMPKSNMNLKTGEKITVKEAILSLIVKSANDVSVALAEAIAGSEEKFVQMMNMKAKKLGMEHTIFANPHGWHHTEQMTTAYDMAILAIALQKHHPSYFPLFSKKSFTFKGRVINGHNRILDQYWGANGMKTGYVAASGYNIVTSIARPSGRLIAVVFGGQTAASRDAHTMALLDTAYQKKLIAKQGNKAIVKVSYPSLQERSMHYGIPPDQDVKPSKAKQHKTQAANDSTIFENSYISSARVSNAFAVIKALE